MLAVFGALDKEWRERQAAVLGLVITSLPGPLEKTLLWRRFSSSSSFFNLLRYPVKFMVFPIFFLALLAARGVFVTRAGSASRASLVSAASACGFAGLLGALFLWCAPFMASLCKADNLTPTFEIIGTPLISAALLALFLVWAIWQRSRGDIRERMFVALSIALVVTPMIVAAFGSVRHLAEHGFLFPKKFPGRAPGESGQTRPKPQPLQSVCDLPDSARLS